MAEWWQDTPAADGSATWDEGGYLPASSGSGGTAGGINMSWLTDTASVLINGLPRLIDAKAGLVRAENTMPMVYRNGRLVPIDPDAARYPYPGQSILGGGNNMLLLLLGGAAVFLLAKS